MKTPSCTRYGLFSEAFMSIVTIAKYLKTRSASRTIGVVAAIVLVSSQIALSQGAVGGRITGRVTDPTGAVIPDATISAQNLSTNIVTKAKSNDSGYYI